ncbi:hypothetical protein D3874_21785 [Oleomonas cavernae]|uniref:Tyr recombinase domain-containing protein n=1 Tax=Oleomonas cavernae TaxID=2320859 RepID=A0A418WGV0_9PROT|nr:tyrosine-type recombinase/integrase [Oleomonas cavernae]RJF89276.1 hypothetical protein D3874_21785 [Oleomonas cavernae]
MVERDGHWHITGTLRIGDRTQRIRQSTGLPAISALRADAEAVRFKLERQMRDAIVHGIKPSCEVAEAADRYLRMERDKPLGWREINVIKQVNEALGRRTFERISDEEWSMFVDATNAGNSAATKRRWLNCLLPFLRWCAHPSSGWLKQMPEIKRPRLPRRRKEVARRRVVDFRPDLIAFLISHAAPHLAAQLWVEWSTGARVSSILFGCRLCDLSLTPGREQIVFLETKNDDSVVASLHPRAVKAIKEYLDYRGNLFDREGPLFLDHQNRPYSDRTRAGRISGSNKTAFRAMRRRAVHGLIREAVLLRRAGDAAAAEAKKADARLLAKVTQHWFRHALATNMLSAGADLKSIMEQGGWRDVESVLAYAHGVESVRRRHVLNLPVPQERKAKSRKKMPP